ncbi:hypothetical protein [Paenibacillus mesophilus]|uniref:hypothetical protein n=1 Tax=Paenibacillus mesophilus TaxID=2582849 RepID=UPI0013052E89|nr:hypothetical protein [Paenibacillus mesophilus]
MNLTFYCSEQNDLYRLLVGQERHCPRFGEIGAALEHARPGSGVLLLADAYPKAELELEERYLRLIRDKRLRIYAEYPSSAPGLEISSPRQALWERGVVSSDRFAPGVEALSILALHGCWFLPVRNTGLTSHLVLTRVAGYDKAVFGLPREEAGETHPLLFELPGTTVLVGASKLSHFVTGRYGPMAAWQSVWRALLSWLDPESQVPPLQWKPDVSVRFGEQDALPPECESDALELSFRWFEQHVLFHTEKGNGAMEGYVSHIDHQGRQMRLVSSPRADCAAESAMVFAYDAVLNGNPASRKTAEQIMNYVWSAPAFLHDRKDSPAYGLVNWYDRGPIFYGDDNARVLLAGLAVSRLLGDDRWDDHLLRCLLANWRTSGSSGFRRNFLRYPESFPEGRGWRHYKSEDFINCAPHYQSYLWACYIWGYALTGYDPLLATAKQAIRSTMEAYPDGWKWTNGLTQEIARMLLPLSFLVHVEDTAEHRGWLERMSGELLRQMQPCGAIAEKIGPLENGKYPPPQSNEAYGTGEAALLQHDGDPVCDLLYTANFAFLGFHEAAAVHERLKTTEDRLADFLCRVQLRSEKHPYLHGAWMRSFDYRKWEYWGSSADLGWGAWCVESGWTNAWIAAVMAMRRTGQRLFDLSAKDRWKRRLPDMLEDMDLVQAL